MSNAYKVDLLKDDDLDIYFRHLITVWHVDEYKIVEFEDCVGEILTFTFDDING